MRRLLLVVLLALLSAEAIGYAADRVVIGNISRRLEQLPNYAATDGQRLLCAEGIQGDVVY